MLDLIREIETNLEDGWEAASRVELQTAEHTRRAVARFTRAMWLTLAILLVFNSEPGSTGSASGRCRTRWWRFRLRGTSACR